MLLYSMYEIMQDISSIAAMHMRLRMSFMRMERRELRTLSAVFLIFINFKNNLKIFTNIKIIFIFLYVAPTKTSAA